MLFQPAFLLPYYYLHIYSTHLLRSGAVTVSYEEPVMVLYERRHDGVDDALIVQTLQTVRAPATWHYVSL